MQIILQCVYCACAVLYGNCVFLLEQLHHMHVLVLIDTPESSGGYIIIIIIYYWLISFTMSTHPAYLSPWHTLLELCPMMQQLPSSCNHVLHVLCVCVCVLCYCFMHILSEAVTIQLFILLNACWICELTLTLPLSLPPSLPPSLSLSL